MKLPNIKERFVGVTRQEATPAIERENGSVITHDKENEQAAPVVMQAPAQEVPENTITQEAIHEQLHRANPRLAGIERILSHGLAPFFETLMSDSATHAHALDFRARGELIAKEIDRMLNE